MDFPVIMEAFQSTKNGDFISERRIIFSHLAANLFADEFQRHKTRIAPFPVKVQAWLEGNINHQVMSERIISKKESLEKFIDKWRGCIFKVLPLSEEEKANLNDNSEQFVELTTEQRNEIVDTIKEKVKTLHSVSIIKTLSEFRNRQQEKDDNFDLRIDQELIHSISMQVIQDDNYDRVKEEKDYYIIFKKKEVNASSTNINVGDNFSGQLLTHSSVSDSDIKNQQAVPTKTATNKATKILIAIIVGVIGGTIAGYLTWLITK